MTSTTTIVVILVTTLVSWHGLKNPDFYARYIFDVQSILRNGEYFRIISSGFLHAGWMHLVFNMLSLYFFGPYIETITGPFLFLLIYFSSLIGGSVLSLWMNKNLEYMALGASGAVSGVVFSCIFLFPGGSIFIFPIPFPIPSWLYAILFVGVSLYGMQTRAGKIGHDAHLGGALSGLLVTFIIAPQAILSNIFLFIIIFGLVIVALIYIHKRFSLNGEKY